MNLNVLGVIPARYASTRFPGKPLAIINGKSMIQRVYEQAFKSRFLSRVIVATDDLRIEKHVLSFGGEVMMTSAFHDSGTERIGEVVASIKHQNVSFKYDIVVNIQGDEPMLNPLQIDLAISCFSDPSIQISTLVKQITNAEDLFNPNVVKAVIDKNADALYFSRSPIPFMRNQSQEEWLTNGKFYKHIGLYAYSTSVLTEIINLAATPLETAESLEQLRWIENGFKIRAVLTEFETIAVDTPEDLLKLTNIIC
jgi:3-deoxy-manno-octulosonate cytidylyltransferase (CMP-KDO synthetase)